MGATATKGGATDLTKNRVSWDIGRCEGIIRGKGEAKAVSFVGEFWEFLLKLGVLIGVTA